MINLGFKLMAFSFTVAGIMILLLSPLVFEWIFEGRYDAGLSVLPITMLYCIWFSMINLLAVYLLVIEKGKWMFAVIGGGLVVNLGLNIALIPTLGLWGAVIATTISMLLTLTAILVVNHYSGLKLTNCVVVAALLPMVVMLHPILALTFMLALTIVAYRTELIFNDEEKSMAHKQVQTIVKRISSRS